MKIIENAMTKPIEITCPECKSVLEYTYKDIQRSDENGFFGFSSWVRRYIVCPVCKKDIDLSPKAEIKEPENEMDPD